MGAIPIQKIIAGLIVFVVSLVLFSPLDAGANRLYLEFVPSCEINGSKVSSTALYVTNDTVPLSGTVTLSNNSGKCQHGSITTTAAAGTATLTFSDDTTFTTAAGSSNTIAVADITGSKWLTVPTTLNQFGDINRLVLSIYPVVIVAGFLTTAFIGIYNASGSGANAIAMSIKYELGILILALVMLYIAPVALAEIADSSDVVNDARFQVNNQFDDILDLLFGVMPIGIILSAMALVGVRAKSAIGSMRGGGGMM